jgi:hypothetical protein
MSDNTPEMLITQLESDDSIARGIAVNRLRAFPNVLGSQIARLFDLTFDDHKPIGAYDESAIKSTKSASVPFLLGEMKSSIAPRRQRAVELLAHIGFWCGATYRLNTQELEPRPDSRPDWGDRNDEVLAAAVNLLSDPELSVRFAAASLLEDVGLNLDQIMPIFIDVLSYGRTYEKN